MKRFLLFIALIFLYPVCAHAQVYPAPPNVGLAAALPHTCVTGAPLNPTQPQWYFATDTSTLYVCISNTASYPSNWGSVSGGTPGSGCVPSGSVGQILSDSGSGACNDSTLTDNGTDVTGSEPLFLGTDDSAAGIVRLSNSAANAHTIFQSGATTTNTIKGFTVVPTTGDLVDCSSATTVCTLTDAGVLAADVITYHTPATGIARTTSASQAVVSTELSGDATTSGSNAVTVVRINGTSLAGLASGILYNTTSTGVPSIATQAQFTAATAAQYKTLTCEGGLGDGLNAIASGTYLQSTCYNGTGVTVTITGVKCYTDNGGSSTLNGAGNTLGALLTGAVTCTASYAAGTQGSNVALTSGDYIKFTFVADGTSKQTDWVVTGTY